MGRRILTGHILDYINMYNVYIYILGKTKKMEGDKNQRIFIAVFLTMFLGDGNYFCVVG